MRHRITGAYFADYADEVMVEVRVWTHPGCSRSEILSLRELTTRMGK
jgi:hypothetical protein